jgi:hypothetical protein
MKDEVVHYNFVMKSIMMEEMKCGIVETIPLGHDWEVCPIQLEKFFIKVFLF